MTATEDEGWTLQPLGKVCEVVQGQSPPGATYNSEGRGLPFFQGKADFGDLYPTASKWCTDPQRIAEPGDVLVSIRAPVGPTNICRERSVIGRGLAALRPRDGLSTKYVLYAVRATEEEMRRRAGGTTFEAIRGKQLREHLIPVAPQPLRDALIEEVERQTQHVRAGAAAARTALLRVRRFRASVLLAACSGRLVETEANLARREDRTFEAATTLLERVRSRRQDWPDTPLRTPAMRLPEGWAWATVAQLATLVQYGTSSKTGPLSADAVPVLRMGNVVAGRIVLKELKYLSAHEEGLSNLMLQAGDLLFNRTNSPDLVGKAAVYEGSPPAPCSFASYLIRVRFVEDFESRFLMYFLNSPLGREWAATVVSQQVGQANINGSKLKALTIPVPPLAEQIRIVAACQEQLALASRVDDLLASLRSRTTLLGRAVLRQAFGADPRAAAG